MLNAIVRLPRMCVQFQQAVKKKSSTDAQRAEETKAIQTLAGEIKDNNTEAFMDQLVVKLDNRKKRAV